MKQLFLTRRAFIVGWAIVVLSALGFVWPMLFALARAATLLLLAAVLIDIVLLYRLRKGISATRSTTARWSNGDENPVTITVHNHHGMELTVHVLDELPVQLQKRDLSFTGRVPVGGSITFQYAVRPAERGVHAYGAVNVLARTLMGLAERRYVAQVGQEIPVYPSFLQLRKYELLAIHDRLTLAGVKRVRRIASQAEFDRIKDYIPGDDRRSVNWKATARRGRMMVNVYQDEKAQQVFSLIDMGRTMRMPFEGLSLLDHAINAALVLGDIALHKDDRAGLITFSNKVHTHLRPAKERGQMQRIMEALYAQHTDHAESDIEQLFIEVERRVHQRSLLVLFTNFESVSALRRQLPHLRRLARKHLLLVVFFRNTELEDDLGAPAADSLQAYTRTITEKFVHEKQLVAKELERYGIGSLLVRPEQLTVNVINRYLAIKARGRL